MSKQLHIGTTEDGKAFHLPVDFVTQTLAVLAKRRVGKTYTCSVMAEELVRIGQPFVVLDPTAAWWGLRADASGKPNGSQVIIIGGAHGDIPLEATAGKVIAELVVENPGQYVIDLSGTNSNAEQDRFVTDFAERLYRLKATHKFPLHLFLDEADSFAPQRPLPGQQRMLGAIEAIVRRGGIRGLGITLITQRPAVLNKNVLTQAECLVILQITAPQDISAIDDWVKNNATPKEREMVVGSLASLIKGNAWFWSPAWLQCLVKVFVRKRETFNSSATPEVGQKPVSVTLASADIEKIKNKVAATIEKAKADDPAELRRQIAALKKEINAKAQSPEVAKTETKIEEKIFEVPVFLPKHTKAIDALRSDVDKILDRVAAVQANLLGISQRAVDVGISVKDFKAWQARPATWTAQDTHRAKEKLQRVENFRAATGHADLPNGNIPVGEKAVLRACIQFPDGLERSQLTVLTGYKRSSRDTYLQRLREKGLVSIQGDKIVVTENGFAALPDAEPLPTGQALQEYWLHKLPQGERKIFEVLLGAYPNSVAREQLSELTGYQRSSRDTYLQRLRSKEVITEPGRGEVRASENLFS